MDPATRPMSRACTERQVGNGLCVVAGDGLAVEELSMLPWWIVSASDLGGRARRRIGASEELGARAGLAWWLGEDYGRMGSGRMTRGRMNEEEDPPPAAVGRGRRPAAGGGAMTVRIEQGWHRRTAD
ncbi:hypothetical protein ZWY2020_035008 [Hordeum vulgare]|nr:hypothetical protein ZWY2020_035008 [Hordeum vulgare]